MKEPKRKILNWISIAFFTVGLALLMPMWLFVLFYLSVITHELGHYALAKMRKVYKGYEISLLPRIKLIKPFPHRLDYLSGFAFSLSTVPLALALNVPLLIFLIILSVLAGLDIVVVIGYDLTKKR